MVIGTKGADGGERRGAKIEAKSGSRMISSQGRNKIFKSPSHVIERNGNQKLKAGKKQKKTKTLGQKKFGRIRKKTAETVSLGQFRVAKVRV